MVYQSVYWLTLVYISIKPRGTYLALPRQTRDDPDGDAEQYRAVRLPMDWGQVTFHYAAVLSLSGCVLAVAAWRL